MKCGYFKMTEYDKPYRTVYECRYFGFCSGSEKVLCDQCSLDDEGVPHIKEFEEECEVKK